MVSCEIQLWIGLSKCNFKNQAITFTYTVDDNHLLGFQCPYYIDADVKLSQSFAIMKYLGRKHHLVPKTEEEKIRVDLTEGEAMDMRFNWSTLCYSSPEEFVR